MLLSHTCCDMYTLSRLKDRCHEAASQPTRVASVNSFVLLCCVHTRLTGVPTATSAKLKANEWVNSALSLLGGKGGGKPTLAQGQGADYAKAADALAAAEQFAAMKL